MKWIKDADFIRGNVPMTKFDARIITIALMEIEKGDIFLDIGAGTGSISIEASLQGAKVYAMEKEIEALETIAKNLKKFEVDVEIINNNAPLGIESLPQFDKIFVGGSGGNLESIFAAAHLKLKPNGILAANFITLKNLHKFIILLEKYGYKETEKRLVQSSVIDERTGLLNAQNPIFIVKGVKK